MMNVDCQAWEALKMGRKRVEGVGAFDAVDELDRKLDDLARKVLADPRRSKAVSKSRPKVLQEMKTRVGAAAGTAVTSADPKPTHTSIDLLTDKPELEKQLSNLDDKQLRVVEALVNAERSKRKK